MRRSAWTAAAFSLLAGCQSDIGARCPPLVSYSLADQRAAAQELKVLLPPDSQVARMIVDYGKMRDACRAGEKL